MVAIGLGRRRRVAAGERHDWNRNKGHPHLHRTAGTTAYRKSRKVLPVPKKKKTVAHRCRVFTDADLEKLDPERMTLTTTKQQHVFTRAWDDGTRTRAPAHVSRAALDALARGMAPTKHDVPSQWAPVSRRLVEACAKAPPPPPAKKGAARAAAAAVGAAVGLRRRPKAKAARKASHRVIMGLDPARIPPDEDRSLSRSFSAPTQAARDLHSLLGRALVRPPLRERPAPDAGPPAPDAAPPRDAVLSAVDAPPSTLRPRKHKASPFLKALVSDGAIFSDQRAAEVMERMLAPIGHRHPPKGQRRVGRLPPEKPAPKPARAKRDGSPRKRRPSPKKAGAP